MESRAEVSSVQSFGIHPLSKTCLELALMLCCCHWGMLAAPWIKNAPFGEVELWHFNLSAFFFFLTASPWSVVLAYVLNTDNLALRHLKIRLGFFEFWKKVLIFLNRTSYRLFIASQVFPFVRNGKKSEYKGDISWYNFFFFFLMRSKCVRMLANT